MISRYFCANITHSFSLLEI